MEGEKSIKEQRIRNITHLYYSKPEVQKALFSFSANREVVPRYFEGFGKRPDALQFPGDIFEMAKKGATSFHCSEELWKNPLELATGLASKQLSEMRIGWDLLIDIDSKYIDYSKISAEIIIDFLKFHGIKNIGLKFSGSKGFHIIVPWKAFPKEVYESKTVEMFPDYARIITQYIIEKTKARLIEKISELERPSKYVKDYKVSEEVMPDLVLVSPRHLFRMPYSLHEKTALASVVVYPEKLSSFQLKDADPLKIQIKPYMPECREGEAQELLTQALDWFKDKTPQKEEHKVSEFKPIQIKNISDKNFPPSIKQILLGVKDGKKRALFILINFFRSIGMEKDELEKRIFEWNKKNETPLPEGYLTAQLTWSYRNKIVPPPNFDKDYYKGIGIIPTEEEMRLKNPVNYMARKSFVQEKKTNNFKNSS
jgi:hypothetical protein